MDILRQLFTTKTESPVETKSFRETQDQVYQSQLHLMRMREVMTHLTNPIFAVEPDGTIFFMSDGAAYAMNVNAQFVEGRRFMVLLPLEPKADIQKTFIQMVEKKEVQRQEVSIQDKSFMMIMTPLSDSENNLIGGVFELKDLTDERKLQQMHIDFVSIVSHELRTPITSITGYLEVVLSEADYLQDEHRTFIERAFQSNERQQRTVEKLLELSDLERGNISTDIEKIQLETIINKVVETWKPKVQEKDLRIQLNYPRFAIPAVKADEQLLYGTLNNLIDNAVKYTPSGSIQVNLEIVGEYVKVMIRDTGIGIEPDKLEGIFSKFVRGEQSLTETTQGTGLGLYLSKRFVELMGGEISVKSIFGEGSEFSFTLPQYHRG